MMVNEEASFIPEILEVYIFLNIKNIRNLNHIDQTHFYIKKSEDISCDESFAIPNFIEKETVAVEIIVEVWWAKDMEIEICTKQLVPPFQRQLFSVEGEILSIPFIFDENLTEFPTYEEVNIKWSTKLLKSNNNNKLCIKIFNHPGLYAFMMNYNQILTFFPLLDKFNYLIIIPYLDTKMTEWTYIQEYIVEILYCDDKEELSKFNIAISGIINAFELNIRGGTNRFIYKMAFKNYNGTFKKVLSQGYYSQLFNVDIDVQKYAKILKTKYEVKSNRNTYENLIGYYKNDQLFSLQVTRRGGKYYVKNAFIFVKNEEENTEYYRQATEDEINGVWHSFFFLE